MKPNWNEIVEWANEMLAKEENPPWAWFQYMKLKEICIQMQTSEDSVLPIGEQKFYQCNMPL